MKTITLLFIIAILFFITLQFYCLYVSPVEYFTTAYDCVISINIHENYLFLLKQLDNIKDNTSCNYCIVLSCNNYMYEECTKNGLPPNVYINPTIINKRVNHGSLTHGIYSNMVYALDNFIFKFFIVASSRNFFKNKLTFEDLDNLVAYPHGIEDLHTSIYDETNLSWHWPNFKNTYLAKYYIEQNKKLYSSPHEGLVFKYSTCKKINELLNNNINIKDDLLNFEGCVEEFALQTIAINEEETFYYIGNGCCNEDIIEENIAGNTIKKFMYKVKRE